MSREFPSDVGADDDRKQNHVKGHAVAVTFRASPALSRIGVSCVGLSRETTAEPKYDKNEEVEERVARQPVTDERNTRRVFRENAC